MPGNNTEQPAANAQPMDQHTSREDRDDELVITFGSFKDSDDESLPKIETNVLEPHESLRIDEAHDSTLRTGSRSDGDSIANAEPLPETNLDVLYGILLDGSKEYRRLEQTLEKSKEEQQRLEKQLAKTKKTHENESDRKTRTIRKLQHDVRCLTLAAHQMKGTEIAQQQSISCLRTDNQFLFQQVTKLSCNNAELESHQTHLMSENDALNRQQTQLLTLNSELQKTHYLQHKSINKLTQQLKSNDQMWVKQKKKSQSEKTGLSGKIDGLTVLLHEYQGKIESMERMMESLRRSSTITTTDTQRGAPPSGQGGHDKRLLLRAHDLPQQTNPTPHTDIESMRIIWGRPHP